jgi:hypothetical protein
MATLQQIGIPAGGTGILHPKHKNRWQVTFSSNTTGNAGANTWNWVTAQLTQFNRPQLEFEEIPLHRYNSIAFVAGKHNWSETTMTVEDDLTGLASQAIQNQLEKQQRLVGGSDAQIAGGQWLNASPSGAAYKFGAVLEQLDGNENVTETWILEGCWLKSVEYGELDYQASEAVTIQVTLRFDHARQTLNGNIGGAGISATGGFINGGSSNTATVI